LKFSHEKEGYEYTAKKKENIWREEKKFKGGTDHLEEEGEKMKEPIYTNANKKKRLLR